MFSRRASTLGAFAVSTLLCSCGSAVQRHVASSAEPQPRGTPVTTFLQSTAGVPLRGLPRFQLSALPGAAEVTWEVESVACVLAQASGTQSGSVLAISIRRAGGPEESCYRGPVGYRYVAVAQGLAPGRYEVHLIDVTSGEHPREVGRGSVVVAPNDAERSALHATAPAVDVAKTPSSAHLARD